MNELRLLIITIPSAFGIFATLDFFHFLYRQAQNEGLPPPETGDRLVREAAQLRDRLIKMERLTFQQYLKAPDTDALQRSRARLEQVRQLYQKAEHRYQRRAAQHQLHEALESFAVS
ncbi:MAG: hypothetical protein SWY16_18070 [Cyanobacteriota bacterium]|nr:hypothetical protein [Cyanobacteriota bacterium]